MYSMGWLWLADSLKLKISFAEYPLFYRALLQKVYNIILRSLLFVATPCDVFQSMVSYVRFHIIHTSNVLVAVCCSVLQCGAVWCGVLQCVAVCCSVLQCVAVCYTLSHFTQAKCTDCSVFKSVAVSCSVLQCGAAWCSVLQRVAMNVLQCVAVCSRVLQCVAVNVLQCVAVCCIVLQCKAHFHILHPKIIDLFCRISFLL